MKKVQNWEVSLNKFISKWKSKKEVIGAIVCGSYITGNPTKHSDIDLHIILDSKATYRERGNEIVDRVLIEYFANPLTKHKDYDQEDFKKRRKVHAHMLCTGKILFDKTGELNQLVKSSRKYLHKKYPKQKKEEIEIAKYHLWDMQDNLEEVFESNSEDFSFVYHNNLTDLFETYSKFLQFDSFPAHKLRRCLENEKDKKKYHVTDFPDQKFAIHFVSLLKQTDKSKMITGFHELTDHILKKMGGFNIDGWKIRSSNK